MPQPRLMSKLPARSGAALVTVDGRTYPLESARIVARAEGGLALTSLVQEFRNPYEEPLEALYALPLPADGAVIGYLIQIGERVIRGEIEKRETASETYLAALGEGRMAGLLEQDRDDTFTQRLGSLPPGEPVRVEIEVLHPLGFVPSAGPEPARWEYRFPTVVGVRYQGEPGRVADAGRLDVDRAGEGEIPTRIDLDLTVADGSPDAIAVVSTTHDIRCASEAGVTRVGFRAGVRLDRDLVVHWNACAERVGVRLVEGPGRPGDDGRYALLTLTPPSAPASALARDVSVLLDASGSMTGEPLAMAKRVVADLLESLEAGDRFELTAFASVPVPISRGLVKATPESLKKSLRALEELGAGGGTEMEAALVEALKPLRQGSQRQVVLVTDGQIGFESRVVGESMRRLPGNARVHTVGVGAAPNRALTRAVARAGRGVEVFACDEPSAAEAARRLCRATVRPVLTELSVEGAAVRGFAPGRPRDVLAGQPLMLALELEPEGGKVEVGGRQAGTADAWIWRITLPAFQAGTAVAGIPTAKNPALAATSLPLGALYGREVIADLELLAAARPGSADDLDRRIEQAGLRHRITSRMTSLVAVAETPSVDPKLPRRRERLAIEVPAGVSAEGSGLFMRGGPDLMLMGAMELRHPDTMGRSGMANVLIRAQGMLGEPWARRFAGAPTSTPLVPPATFRGWVPPTEHPIPGGRLLRVSPRGLTVEFETPFEGFAIPDGEINLWLEGTTWLVARVVPEESTPRGPQPAGLVVRLTLSITGHPKWVMARSIDLRWLTGRDGNADGSPPRQIILSVALPKEASRPR